jgi:hypothetical protein
MGTITRELRRRKPKMLALAAARALHPSWTKLLLEDALQIRGSSRPSQQHLRAAMDWLCRAQDATRGGGVSAGYSLIQGWLPPYSETTGYIIDTFCDYARVSGREEFIHRAVRMANWEIKVQLPTGAVRTGIGDATNKPAAFNTGQVILGWCRTFRETRRPEFLEPAKRAAQWLMQAQDDDGAWRMADTVTETKVHAYDIRTAWSLLELHEITGDRRLLDSARRNVRWTLEQQTGNGWFENNAFFVTVENWRRPFTHTIAYVMEGLMNCSRLLRCQECFAAAKKTATRLMRIFELRRFLAGEFDNLWKSDVNYSCLTGDAQIAGVWLRLFEAEGDVRFLNAALKLNDYVKATQRPFSLHPGIRGGIKGSHPIYGHYTRFAFPNWAAKFLADSLMLEQQVMSRFEASLLSRRTLEPFDSTIKLPHDSLAPTV